MPVIVFLYATALELLVVLAALLLSTSMERNAVLFGYSAARLGLIGLVAVMLIGFGVLSRTVRAGKAIPERLRAIVDSPNARLAVRDFLAAGAAGVAGLLALYAYSPRFLGFVWGPLPAVVERTLPLLLFAGFFCLQSLALVARWESTGEAREWLQMRLTAAFPPVLVFLILLATYVWSARLTGLANPNIAYFPALAEAFLEGDLHLEKPPITKDLSLFDGRYYVAFPPLGALLFLPAVARYTRFGVDAIGFSGLAAAAGGAVLYLALRGLVRRKWVDLDPPACGLVAIAVGLGTPLFYMTTTGAVWHISQVLTFLFLSIAIAIVLANRSDLPWANFRTALLSGLAMGLAMLARPHVALTGLFVLGVVYQHFHDAGTLTLRRLVGWAGVYALPGALATAGLLWYNAARFGNPLDFGYAYMLVGPELVEPLATYGQFHPHFILQNLKANWLGLPYWHAACRRLMPPAQGMSLFVTTPVAVYAFRTFPIRRAWLAGAWLSVAAIAGLHLLYFNTGAHQFGYRFGIDFIPILACILAAGLPHKWTRVPVALVLFGVGVNFIGVLWNAKQFCDTW